MIINPSAFSLVFSYFSFKFDKTLICQLFLFCTRGSFSPTFSLSLSLFIYIYIYIYNLSLLPFSHASPGVFVLRIQLCLCTCSFTCSFNHMSCPISCFFSFLSHMMPFTFIYAAVLDCTFMSTLLPPSLRIVPPKCTILYDPQKYLCYPIPRSPFT